jgi:hypothetical protein
MSWDSLFRVRHARSGYFSNAHVYSLGPVAADPAEQPANMSLSMTAEKQGKWEYVPSKKEKDQGKKAKKVDLPLTHPHFDSPFCPAHQANNSQHSHRRFLIRAHQLRWGFCWRLRVRFSCRSWW